MKKVIVIGCPGSGKSTFSRALHDATGLPLFHLDMMYWNADRSIVDKPIFLQRLSNTMQNDAWIIDGNYASTLALRLQACDTVIFLDYPLDVCLRGIQARKGSARPDMPWVEQQDEEDADFIQFIKNYNSQNRPTVLALLKQHSDKQIHIFKTRNEANDFLNHMLDKNQS